MTRQQLELTWVGKDACPRVKNLASEREGVSAWTWWSNREVGHNQEAKLVRGHQQSFLEAWNGQFPPTAGERVTDVRCTDDTLVVDLADGRTIITPLAWYPRLLHATPAERARWERAGGGFGVHWPALDEDLSVCGMLRGAPATPGTWPTSTASAA